MNINRNKKVMEQDILREYKEGSPIAIGMVVIISSVLLIYAILRIVLNVIDSLA